jgi:hypothetical protein
MSGKRPSLADNLRAVAEAPPNPPATVSQTRGVEPSPAEKPPHGRTPPKGFFAATRAGKKKATATLSNEAHRQLKLLAVDHGGVEALLTEAINDLFRKHGKPPIA